MSPVPAIFLLPGFLINDGILTVFAAARVHRKVKLNTKKVSTKEERPKSVSTGVNCKMKNYKN